MEQKTFFDAFSSKTSFGIGFISAILVLGTLGFVILGGCLLKGGCSLGDSDGSTIAIADDQQGEDATNVAAAAAKEEEPAVIPVVSETDHLRGDVNAPITMIEYSDFECPYCSSFHTTMIQVMDEYDGQVRWVYRHFPLSFHPSALPAAEASECASEQGKFWEYADGLVENRSNLSETTYLEIARTLGLDVTVFQSCLDSDRGLDVVGQDYQGGITAGVTGTPATFVIDQDGNATPVKGALPFSSIQSLMDQLLGS